MTFTINWIKCPCGSGCGLNVPTNIGRFQRTATAQGDRATVYSCSGFDGPTKEALDFALDTNEFTECGWCHGPVSKEFAVRLDDHAEYYHDGDCIRDADYEYNNPSPASY